MQNELVLYRVAYLPDATLGVLLMGGIPRFTTLEDPWNNNERGISCIPLGSYHCSRFVSTLRIVRLFNKKKETFRVDYVPHRSGILFHVGNTHAGTRGCVLLGLRFGNLGENHAVLSSGPAFKEFMRRLEPWNAATLRITNANREDILDGFGVLKE